LVSENGENGLGDEGADGAMPLQNIWARTAPVNGSPFTIKTERTKTPEYGSYRQMSPPLSL